MSYARSSVQSLPAQIYTIDIISPTHFVAVLQHFLDTMKYDIIGVCDHLCIFHSSYLDQMFLFTADHAAAFSI
jgi:hypothetical protein